jgi:hypothetical protein
MEKAVKLRMKALASLLALAPSLALAKSSTTAWTLDGSQGQKPQMLYLSYEWLESSDVDVSFSCVVGSGMVSVFVADTSEKLRAGRPAKAIVAAGDTKAEVSGKIVQGQTENGGPSFEGEGLTASDPLFKAMGTAATLVLLVGPSKQTTPLAGIGDKAARFSRKCARP